MKTFNKLKKTLASLLFVLTFFISVSATAMPTGRISYESRSLSDLMEEGDFDQLIELLTLRKDCREHASYEACGMDPDEIIVHKSDHGMKLLHQIVTHDFDGDYFPVTSDKKITVISLLLSEGIDYLAPLQTNGENALTLAIKYKNPDILLALLDATTTNEKNTIVHRFHFYGDKLSHLAAKYMPEDEALHQELQKYGFNYDEKNRKRFICDKPVRRACPASNVAPERFIEPKLASRWINTISAAKASDSSSEGWSAEELREASLRTKLREL